MYKSIIIDAFIMRFFDPFKLKSKVDPLNYDDVDDYIGIMHQLKAEDLGYEVI